MTALEQALRTALLHFVWQGVVVAFVLWIGLFLMRNRTAHARYVASCLALLALIALPVITACAVYRGDATPRATAPLFATVPQTVAAVWTESGVPAANWLASLAGWALPAWALGVILFSIRLGWGSRQVAVLRRSGEPADGPVVAIAASLATRIGLARPVRLLISSLAEGPSVVGWIRPVILLPAATLIGLTPEQLEAVLAHEFAHIRRYDYLVNVLQMMVETILFYHPAVWWTSGRIRHERELCCDDLAVSLCGDPLCYARALTKLERLRTLAPNMALGSTDGPLLYRIQRLTGAATRRLGPSKLPGVLAILLTLACAALFMDWTRVQAQNIKAPQPPKAATAPTPAVADAPGVQVDLGGASALVRVPVAYPKVAIEDEIEGRVEVELSIDHTGNVQSTRVLSGPEELRDSVLASVRKWNFDPATVHTPLVLTFGFRLPDVDADSDDDDNDSSVEMDSGSDSDNDNDADEPENSMADIESALSEAEAAVEEAESELSDKLRDIPSQIEEAQQALEKLGKSDEYASLMDGRTLKRVRILGVSEESRAKLLKLLPVHEGDTLSKDLIAKLGKAVHDFDSQLDCMVVPAEDHDATVVIRRK